MRSNHVNINKTKLVQLEKNYLSLMYVKSSYKTKKICYHYTTMASTLHNLSATTANKIFTTNGIMGPLIFKNESLVY